jgi:hypothetical protein
MFFGWLTACSSQAAILVPTNAVWKYLDNGSDQGTAWKERAFNDSAWASGPAQLGYGDGDEATVVSFGPNSNAKYITTYFRRTFTVTNVASYTNLTVQLLRDDGAVVYLNGTEVFRSNMPVGPITFTNVALAAVSGADETTFFSSGVSPALLREGSNVLAVEIHQNVGTSTDLSFDLQLTGEAAAAVNSPPTVSITAPSNNTSVAGPVDVLIVASASDSDGSVSLVEFFANAAKLSEDATSPYAFNWASAPVGTYSLTAVATDNGGAVATSAPISLVITSAPSNVLVATGSVWKYLDNGTNLGTAWQAPSFDDSTWASGPGQLGYGDGDEATVVGYGPDSNAKYITTYFRRAFDVASPSTFTYLTLRVLRDDGVVVYLNGTEAYRNNMPAGTIDYLTVALAAASDENAFLSTPLSTNLLVVGRNVLAVEIHQNVGTSSDISFDLELIGNTGAIINNPPTVSLTSPANNASFSAPAEIMISASASDSDGSVSKVEFFQGTTLLSEDTAAPYSFTWSSVPVGNYHLKAVATDNFGARATSSVVNVTVAPSSPPVVQSVNPAAGPVSSLRQITVTFSEPVQGVDAGDLLINGLPATSLTGADAVYSFSFSAPREGVVSIAWRGSHGIVDFENPPQRFDNYAAGATWQYTLTDTVAPQVAAILPAPSATVSALTKVQVTFNEAVVGVNAGDLLINGTAATSLTGSGAGPYEFGFAQPAPGSITMSWLVGHGIRDAAAAANGFAGGSWTYNLDTNAVFQGQVVINEIMFHPASQITDQEYIEIRNISARAVNLTGWRFNQGVDFTFPALTLNPGAFLVVAANVATFQAKYPTVSNVVGGWTGRLSNSEEDVELEDALGNRVDIVHYADEGDWAVRRPWTANPSGWEWYAEADGLGKSLELRNPALRNDSGQNWLASLVNEGTPGQPNSVASTNIAPLILDVIHFPAVPRSTEPVTVTAEIADEATTGRTVKLWSRNASSASPPAFTSVVMFDDGAHNDSAGGDGIYGAILPALADGTVVEFYVEATDSLGQSRTWPAPATTGGQVVNAIYQVDDEVYAGLQPLYRVIMTEAERAWLASSSRDDAEMNATFVTVEGGDIKIRYNCGLRYRGAGSRGRNPASWRLNIPRDRKWNNKSAINLNSQYTHAQVVGSQVAFMAGLPAEHARPVQLRINSVNQANSGSPQFGSYNHVEPTNDELAENLFPDDPAGNVYRASIYPWTADLTYRGTDPNSYYTAGYYKTSNASEYDYTDLMKLTFAVDPATTPDSDYVRAVEANAKIPFWLRYFAVCSLMDYSETSLCDGEGDDYGLYRGILDPRFVVIAHDFDTIFNEGDSGGNISESIFVATKLSVVNRLLHHSKYEPLYYAELLRQLNTTFATNNLFPLFDQHLGSWPASTRLPSMKDWVVSRNANVRNQIPAGFDPPAVATIAGEPPIVTYVTSATLTVGGDGITHYKYKLNNGTFGAETAVGTAISLSSLANGTYTVFVIGRNASGAWQAEADATASQTWTVNRALAGLVINEILARNDAAVNYYGTFPDLIELYNAGSTSVNLEGMRITDDPANPNKYVFPTGTSLAAGAYLVLYANNPDGTPGLHLGFNLNQDGETIYLFDKESNGGRLLDSVVFGLQLADKSVGRLSNGNWGLTSPTFGSVNVVLSTGNPATLKINEWLAVGLAPFLDDFVEIYNPDPLPVALGGLFLSDKPMGSPGKHPITPLSFIAGYGYRVFVADGQETLGANHVNFRLSPEQGEIGLLNDDQVIIDHVVYGAQQPGVAEGRSPSGAATILFLDQPTPGAGNPYVAPPPAPQTVTLVSITNTWRYEASGTDLGTNWHETAFNDSAWLQGPALLAVENCGCLPAPILTPLTFTSPQQITFYFRTHFNLSASLDVSELQINHIIDDGAVFYINGQEVARFNLPAGDVQYGTLASTVGDATYVGPVTVPLAAVHTGDNVLAVEVHQASASSSDIVFGLRLEAVILTNTPAVAGVVLNEVLANNRSITNADGTITDWIELYNPSNAGVDLADMSLTDDTLNPRRWIFPAGSVAPAKGYLLVRFDPNSPATTNSSSLLNTGFGLKASGDEVYLFNRLAGGGELLDGITFGIQAPDWSIGRVPDGADNWLLTLPNQAGPNLAATLGDPRQLKVNEWMANPVPGKDDWFEIYNPNAQPVALGGLYLTDDETKSLDQQHRIAPRSFIATGLLGFQEFKADGNTAAGGDHVNFKLSGSGELIRISDTNGTVLIDKVIFGSQTEGVSEGRLPDGSTTRVFFAETPTPGESNFLPIPNVVINEVLTHSDLPLEDAVELRNLSAATVNIGGWYLSDARTYLEKYRIADGTTIQPNGYVVFYEYQFNPRPGDPDSFALSSAKGDNVYLSAAAAGALTGYRQVVSFGPSENGVSFGRYYTSVGVDFVAMSLRTFGVDSPETVQQFRTGTGLSNSLPKVGPIVINEIMYHPPDIGGTNDNVADEFIELHNITGFTIPLYDTLHPSNTWRLREAVSFNFRTNTSMPPGGYLLVVSFDPVTNATALAAFRTKYSVSNSVPIVGPYSGKLDNSSESVELYKPDPPQTAPSPDAGLVPYVLVDRLVYSDLPPWPVFPDGFGDSLQRRTPSLYGNDVANWLGSTPTPGAGNFGASGNTPPVLNSIGSKSVIESNLLTFGASATDAESPPQILTFSLDAGAPLGASIDPDTGVFTWRPTEFQGPASYQVTIRVTDDGTPNLSDAETITILVNEANLPPNLSAIGNKASNEGTLLTFRATANDPDLPTQTLTFTLDPGAPNGATINPSTGDFAWTPTEEQGPGSYPITVRVTDNGSPTLSDSETITITVAEVNSPPTTTPVANQTVAKGDLLAVQITALDADLPAQTLSFSLDLGAPAGSSVVSLNPTTVEFRWTPTESQGPSTNTIRVRITDNGTPSLSVTNTFVVVVTEAPTEPLITSILQTAPNKITLTWQSEPGKTYQVQYSDTLETVNWQNLDGTIVATQTSTSATDNLAGRVKRFYRVVQLN